GAVMERGALQALVPALLMARTNQLYDALYARAMEPVVALQVPVPAAQPAVVALMVPSKSTPDVFCTSNSYDVALDTAFQENVGPVVARVPVGEIVVGAAG